MVSVDCGHVWLWMLVGALQWEGGRRDSSRWHSHPCQHEWLHKGSEERDICSPPSTDTGWLTVIQYCCAKCQEKSSLITYTYNNI